MKRLVLTLLFFLGMHHMWGQVVGASIFGTVKDDTGAGLPEASVTIKNIETGSERKLITDDAGRHAAPSISPNRASYSRAPLCPRP